jgi:FkbM family methyltransferase
VTVAEDVVAAAAALQENPTTERARTLRALRVALVEEVLATPLSGIEALWRGSLKDPVRLIREAKITHLLPDEREAALAARIRRELEASLSDREAISRPLFAAMMTTQAFEMPLPPDLFVMPRWVRAPFGAWQLDAPTCFSRVGDADRYVEHMRRFARAFRGLLGEARDADIVPKMVAQFATTSNFLQTYFNDADLRDLMADRGAILAAFARDLGVTTLRLLPRRRVQAAKLKVGVLAAHYGPQTETYFTLGMFEHLRAPDLELTLYALRRTGHDLERLVGACADRVVWLDGADLSAVASKIAADDLDALFFATNTTAVMNTVALAGCLRLARLQIVNAASPITSGLPHADVYLLGDDNETHPDAERHFTEKLATLPGSITVYAYQHDHDPPTSAPTRASLGISDDALVFFSGANFYKILPELSRDWARILSRVPGSVLVLMPFNPNWSSHYASAPFIDRLHTDLAEQGVDPRRLRIFGTVPTRADVHRMQALADVYLDPYPFAGACSMLDALWVGLPPVARQNGLFRGSVGAAMLRMVDLGELASSSSDGYVDLAVALAGDAKRRSRVTERLRSIRSAGVPPYMDSSALSQKVAASVRSLVHADRAWRGELDLLDAAALRGVLQRLADRVVPSSREAAGLTDTALMKGFVRPFFASWADVSPGERVVLDVGACYGEMSLPLLADGFRAVMFEPDPTANARLHATFDKASDRVRIEPLAVTTSDAPTLTFHKAATTGLSGRGASPHGPTAEVLEVGATRLDAYCKKHAIDRVDFLKIDAEGYDFDALESFDFEALRPRLVMVEFGTMFALHTPDAIDAALAKMAARGYAALVLRYTDHGNFARGVFHHDLVEVVADRRASLSVERGDFGNIFFYPADDAVFLRAFIELLAAARARTECVASVVSAIP